MIRRSLTALLLACLLALPAAGAPDPSLRIIAHPGVPEASISPSTLERIYLGKRTRWEDDKPIVPVMLKGGELHEAFLDEVLGRSEAKFMTYWKQAVFTGRGIPPRSFSSEEELVKYVASTPGAVGYVSAGRNPAGVKTLELE